ncbi:hemin ABC transporter substrate-binding protein [Arthrobacter sp.]|uniref:heme/hemin ABC transporter substrate-binding protein n=1 Tax=Arthrobacter sp. TaxID=1667 RepID=UPI0026DFCC1A|nr:ABC transporter substrate-binding protein [Arthrobacter sp.]MDO5754238.1 ABC transporter substrate-binding protein [Arthrobacter sp.]
MTFVSKQSNTASGQGFLSFSRKKHAAVVIATVTLAAWLLSACAPVTPGPNPTPVRSSPQAAGPVDSCTDGTAGKLPLPASWQQQPSSSEGSEAGTPTGPTTAETSGISLPIVAKTPVPTLPVTVASCDGEEVLVTDVSRIVTIDLSGTLTEIVHGLGLGANVVGRDRAADFPEAAHATIVTPTGHDLNAEAITALNPSLVLTDTTIGPLEVQEQLRAVGIPVVFFDPSRTLPGISHQINAVAGALGVPQAGIELNGIVEADMVAALSRVPHTTTPTRIAFLYVRGTAGVYLMAGPGSGADDMIKAVGAIDVGTDIGLKMPFTQLTSEALIKAAPDALLLMSGGLKSVGGVDGLLKVQGIAQTPAGADKRIIDVADGSLLGFGPRTGQIIKALSLSVHGAR